MQNMLYLTERFFFKNTFLSLGDEMSINQGKICHICVSWRVSHILLTTCYGCPSNNFFESNISLFYTIYTISKFLSRNSPLPSNIQTILENSFIRNHRAC